MTVTSLPFSSSTLRSSASAYFAPSWKMWPISMPRAVSSSPVVTVGAGVAVAHLGGLDGAVGGEVATGDEVEHVAAVHVGTGDPAGALDDPRVEQVADARLRGLPQRAGADVALRQRGVLRELGLVHRLDLGRLHHPLEPLLVDVTITGQPDGQRLAGAVGVLEHHQHVLQGVAGVPGRSSRGYFSLRWSTSVWIVGVSGVSSACAAGASSYGTGAGGRTCTASTLAA